MTESQLNEHLNTDEKVLQIKSLQFELDNVTKENAKLQEQWLNAKKAYEKVSAQAQVWNDAFEYMAEKLVEK